MSNQHKDPFVTLEIDGCLKTKTKVCKDSLAPTFNHEAPTDSSTTPRHAWLYGKPVYIYTYIQMRCAQIRHRASFKRLQNYKASKGSWGAPRGSFWDPDGSAEVLGRFGGVPGRFQGGHGRSQRCPAGSLEQHNFLFLVGGNVICLLKY